MYIEINLVDDNQNMFVRQLIVQAEASEDDYNQLIDFIDDNYEEG